MADENSVEKVEAISVALGLTTAVSELVSEVKKVKNDERTTRRWTRIALVSLALDILLTAVIGVLSFSDHSLNQRLAQSQLIACHSSNAVRADDIKLWDTALKDIDPQSKVLTPAEAQSKANFQKFIDKTFAPIDCSKVPAP